MKLFPGSVSDTVTVKGLLNLLGSMDSKRITMAMGRRFYAENNMIFMTSREGSTSCYG